MSRFSAAFAFLFLCFVFSCQSPKLTNTGDEVVLPQRPNILWLVTEDMGPYLPSFGDSTIRTPNLSRLASEGVLFTNVFSPSGVCAPSRASIATGMYPSSIGASHMRTTSYTEVTGLPSYEAVPPPETKMFSELLRMGGYYCTNNSKNDYQFQAPVTAWDENGKEAHWRNRDQEKPFFSIFNFGVTHESGLFEPYDREELVSKDTEFPIPPYLPNNDVVKRDMWKMYNNIALMDRQVGEILDQLEEDGLLESTIIFFYGDHGGPLPRQKRLVYDAGLKVPLIIRYPHGVKAGTSDDQLVSFVDFASTLLTLAGQELPSYLQGQSFIESKESERSYIHAAGDRFDGFTDAIRAVRDKRFKYIRNYRPEQGYYLPVSYRERIPTMQELLKLRDDGTLDEIQVLWFRENKPREELFDCSKDPHEIYDLAQDPEYADKLAELSKEMDRWLSEIGDRPNTPEIELITALWNGESEQPVTAEPEVRLNNGKLSIDCETGGASIGYRLRKEGLNTETPWQIYEQALTIEEDEKLEIQAHRIGYKPSSIVLFEGE